MATNPIPIERFYSTGGTPPTEGHDATSGIPYDAWAVNNEIGIQFRIPDGFVEGSLLKLAIEESTPGTLVKHQLQATTLLIEKDTTLTNVDSSEVFTAEYTSPSTAHRHTSRLLSITDSSGDINGTPPVAKDLVYVKLKRIAASASEDPNSIKVLALTVLAQANLAIESDLTGRLATIVAQIRADMKETGQAVFTDQMAVAAVNLGYKELAIKGLFRQDNTVDTEVGVYKYNLLTELGADHVRVNECWWHDAYDPMTNVENKTDFERLRHREGTTTTGTPEYYMVQSNVLYVWPAPDTAVVGGIQIFENYRETELSVDNPDPNMPDAYDDLLVCYANHRLYLRDRNSTNSLEQAKIWFDKFEAKFMALQAQGRGQTVGMRPYRSM